MLDNKTALVFFKGKKKSPEHVEAMRQSQLRRARGSRQ